MKYKHYFLVLALSSYAGVASRAADTYKVDPAHSSIAFSVRHLGINNVKGLFTNYTGTVQLNGNKIEQASGVIQTASIDTGVAQRDNHLRSPDFFDAAKFPTISFKTKRVEQSGHQTVLIADFTMRGVTREIRLPVTVHGPVTDPQGAVRAGIEARGKLNRKDYGIAYSQALESGVALIGEEVAIELDVEAVKQGSGRGK